MAMNRISVQALLLTSMLMCTAGGGCLRKTTTVECDHGLRCPTGMTCAANQNVCIRGACGNGEVDYLLGELCDDGNILSADGCSGDCQTIDTCGNGKLDPPFERCDWSIEGTECSDDCASDLECGNGFRDRHEVCDDGNTISGDGCNAACSLLEYCGDLIQDQGEECLPPDPDGDGKPENSEACDADCTLPMCGDGHLNALALVGNTGYVEACDEGLLNSNAPNADCRKDCQLRRCGDGILDTLFGEECDDLAGNSDVPNFERCRTDCKPRRCGDGILDTDFDEQCDDPAGNSDAANATCRVDCTPRRCGDGILDTAFDEVCDDADGNSDIPNLDVCRTDCKPRRCGDGIRDEAFNEDCDEGSDNSDVPNAECRTDCRSQRCGDGILDDSEECDGGNGTPRDTRTCDLDCTVAICGDGYHNAETDEQCDAGDENSNARNATCRTDCTPRRCGDDIRDDAFGEQCDRGDDNSDDANAECRTDCQRRRCGDGIIDDGSSEQCDLGNSNSNAPNARCRVDCTPRRCGDGVIDAFARPPKYAHGSATRRKLQNARELPCARTNASIHDSIFAGGPRTSPELSKNYATSPGLLLKMKRCKATCSRVSPGWFGRPRHFSTTLALSVTSATGGWARWWSG